MATRYRLYRNNGAGGPVDYTTIVTNTASLTFNTPAMTVGSDNLFAVRAYDDVSLLEEDNVDQVLRIRVDGAGLDVSGLPDPPVQAAAVVSGSGKVRVSWRHVVTAGGTPTQFSIWATVGGSVNYGVGAAATVTWVASQADYSVEITGLSAGLTSFGVRATNAVGTETNTSATGQATARTSGPAVIENIAGTAAGPADPGGMGP